jgi:hypothetical protein
LTALRDHKIESGKPSGALKIKGVPELPESEITKVPELKVINEVLERAVIFYGEQQHR